MTHLIRIFCLTTLVVLIGLTSQTMAVARGHSAATGQIVLCVGGGTQTISVDANGQPTQGSHFCPECVLAAWDTPSIHTSTDFSTTSWIFTAIMAQTSAVPEIGPWGLGARGPPRHT